MNTRRPFLSLAAAVAAALSLTLAGCGGGNAEPPPDNTVTDVVPVVPVVTITNNVAAETATGAITFTFSFNVDVGTSFTVDDVTVVDGGKGAFTRSSGTSATLVVTPPAASAGLVVVTVPAGAVSGAAGAVNEAVTAQKAFDTRVVTPPSGDTLLADFDTVLPPVAGFEGAEGSAVAPCPAGGGSGNCFMVLRSGGQVFALGIIETTVPITATQRTISAQVFSPTAGIPMVMKVEGPGGANSGDVAPNEAVVAGWQTLTWTFAGVDPALTFNKIVLLPNLGTVDAPPGQSYYFDGMMLVDAPPPPPPSGTVLANFDDVLPPVAGFEGAEGSAVVPCPAGGGSGNCFMVLRSGGQVFALGIIETTVPITATRRTISAQVFSPAAGIPMVLKVEGPGGANSGDVAPNEAVVAGWQTLTWTFAGVDPALTFNKIVLLPNLGTVDAPPGQSYYFDGMLLREAAAAPSATVLANFDDVLPPVAGFEGAEGSVVEPAPAGGGSGNAFKVLRSGGQVFALGIIETDVPVAADRLTISAQVNSPTAGIPMVLKLEGPGGANSGDVSANEAVVAGWQTLTWTFTGIDLSKTYNKMVLLPNLGTVDAPPGKAYYFDDFALLGGAGGGGGISGPLTFSSGFAGGNRTVEGGEFGGFSGSNLDGFGCNGLPENCGGGGDVAPAVAAADSFFFYYYQTPVPADALYAGIYVQAPGVTGGLSATADTPGLQLAGQTQIKFNFNPNPEWFGTATNNFMVQFDMGKLYDTGGPCHIQLRKVVTPTSADQAAYALDLDSFAVVQNCGVAGLTAASVLATQPISQVSFQAAGGGAAVGDGAKTTGANLSAPNGAGVYPTTLVLKGGIRFE